MAGCFSLVVLWSVAWDVSLLFLPDWVKRLVLISLLDVRSSAQDFANRLWSVELFIVLLSWFLDHEGPCAIVADILSSIVLPATAAAQTSLGGE
jgi:hypothetical protein